MPLANEILAAVKREHARWQHQGQSELKAKPKKN
jgi:hypothetical protein